MFLNFANISIIIKKINFAYSFNTHHNQHKNMSNITKKNNLFINRY